MKLDEVIKMRGEIAACERRLESLREMQTAITASKLAEEIFRRVDGMSCTVLFKRYVMCKTFAQIASETNYSEPNIYYWHR